MQAQALRALMHLLETHKLDDISYADWAREAGLKTSDLYKIFPQKRAVMRTLLKDADEAMHEAAKHFEDDMATEDKLFDLLMTHFETLDPYKPIVRAFFESCTLPGILDMVHGYKRLDKILNLAGDETALPRFMVLKGFGLLYMRFFYVWMHDESDDLSATMAEIQKRLMDGKKWIQRLVDFPLFSVLK